MNPLSPGKIPIRLLNSTVLKMTGAASDKIVTPPKAGLDFAAVKLKDGYMLVSGDPITGVIGGIGKYAINVSANDIATSGNRPQFAETVVLLPEGSGAAAVRRIAEDMSASATALGISIVGGHTEVTPGLKRPIVVVTVFSFVEKYVSSRDAGEGDSIFMTKTAGVEGTGILASEGRLTGAVPARIIYRAKGFAKKLSVVEEAVSAYGTGAVHAMHDCTEGGVLGAVYEMSLASGLGFELEERLVPVADETHQLCEHLSLDPLRLIGSGSLLMAVEKGGEARVRKALSQICKVTRIGEFTGGKRILITKDGSEEVVRSAPEDELWRALERAV